MNIFSKIEVQRFVQEGFIVKHHFFDASEVEIMQKETNRLLEEGTFRNVSIDEDGNPSETSQNLQLIPLYDQSRIFRALPFQEKMIHAVSELIGDPYLLRLDQIFVKPARNGLGTSWHQDNAYFNIENPLKGLAAWIAIDDANSRNGAMQLIPGLHLQKFEHRRDPFSDHHIRCNPPEEQALTIEIKAGGVIFFCYGVPHQTGPNLSERSRAGLAYHYIHQDCITEQVHRFPNRCRYMTGPKASGGKNEYGIEVENDFVAAKNG